MIDKLTQVDCTFASIGSELPMFGGTSIIGAGADLDYAFKPSRSAWDKIGGYVNFAPEYLTLTLKPDVTGMESIYQIKAGEKVTVKLNGTDEYEGIVSNSCFVSYPEDVAVDVSYPVMLKYFRIDIMLGRQKLN